MTLLDAIKTNEPFKREDWSNYTWIVRTVDGYRYENDRRLARIEIEDAISNDWEVKQ